MELKSFKMKRGNNYAQTSLENYYEIKKKTKDEEKIFHWYMKSAEEGNTDGPNKLGNFYLLGIGTTNYDKTFQWYISVDYIRCGILK
ncbi:hypothetical protein Glove_165g126 [Diversispora epigaea]|uniref:Uncharacterized protein n=1 Tax=Diversispora epigaea TaxID=1348612 RepID=A0A397IUJ5_9GLOM|nr:hypothetical protein Glove_165g126 [Diversispora epigaea]